ncbi:SIMPL domain-containing protein [Caulobacter sp.]|uniref:SIMPL domain-containing protein n=1 Tax=Caulobacter sp. TaxID=78 RepID=UPI001B2D02EB|nr:SIMPL domain-containing protein [Caulobacter sp.]MBO9543028.1 SIMPL domain-containing protein [Caulobacter sp.]
MRHALLAISLLAVAAPALAAEAPAPTINVVGSGRAERLADYAFLNFTLRGEGAASPEAVKALALAQARLEASLPKLPGKPTTETRSFNLQIREVRAKGCENRGYPQMTSGDCTIVGSIATQGFQLRITPASRAGDAASLIAQLGGADVNASGGGVTDDKALNEAAMRDAIADAKRQAQLIAAASGVKLGPIVRVQDSQEMPIGAFSYGAPPPPPPPPPLPVSAVQLTSPLNYAPQPIVRTARVMVTYGLEP